MGGYDEPAHAPGVRKGEEIKEEHGTEPGREEKGTSHAGRPTGGRTARDATGINPDHVKSVTGGPEMPPA
ncbi:MAG: hypothetical protein C5B44_05040 [Acidobacteria bacterium]|nr:MAG: hypothetical protein C5B44_05040 [Acidobacteriota bacterium]